MPNEPYSNREIDRDEKGHFLLGYPHNKGMKRSDEAKEKNRKAHLGKKASEETKEKMRNKIVSIETRKKLSKKSKGRKHSDESREKISRTRIAMRIGKGIKLSEDTRKKISLSRIGRPSGMLGKKHKIETRKKMSEVRSGEKSFFWRGGITEINFKIRHSFEYKLWRESVFRRDDWTCVWCKQKGGVLNADHIKSFSLYPELRFAIDNGRTLCVVCHRTTDTYGGKSLKKYNGKKLY